MQTAIYSSWGLACAAVFALCAAAALAQSPPSQPNEATPEQPLFSSKINVVLVPVVVRDVHGRAVGSLTKDDFEVFDRGKRQVISSFASPECGTGAGDGDAPASVNGNRSESTRVNRGASHRRSFIYVFDDVNIRFADMAQMRSAAIHHFEANLGPEDIAAIYTFSGSPMLDFTRDRRQLEDAASKLRWRAVSGRGGMQCPDVSYYLADLILDKNDGQALTALTYHTAECAHMRPEMARGLALMAAQRKLASGAEDTRIGLATVRRAIRRLSGLPGERILVLVSPGFFAQTPPAERSAAQILDLAAKSNIIVNALSVRGVILAEEEVDVAARGRAPGRASTGMSPQQFWVSYRRESARADGDVMKDFADGTGGVFFHNNNDLGIGFEKLSAAPEFCYVLGFSPAALKADGSFHVLKVRVPNLRGVTINARRGYYALARDPAQDQWADIADEVFSRDQIADIPVVLQTGYTKPLTGGNAKVLIVAKIEVDVSKQPGRHRNWTSMAAIFDQDGGYVAGAAQTAGPLGQMPDQKNPAVTLRFKFPDIKAGGYLIRLVVVEPESGARTALNRPVDIT